MLKRTEESTLILSFHRYPDIPQYTKFSIPPLLGWRLLRLPPAPFTHAPTSQTSLRPFLSFFDRQIDIAIMIKNFVPFLDSWLQSRQDSLLPCPELYSPAPLPPNVWIAVMIRETPQWMHRRHFGAPIALVDSRTSCAAEFAV